jgi:hypothetical protein
VIFHKLSANNIGRFHNRKTNAEGVALWFSPASDFHGMANREVVFRLALTESYRDALSS